jgi:LmbE family N-acetylglucosaminyl deacetylase
MAGSHPGERIVVVSPHSDDGVLSLGASMAGWRRGGARVELLTVLALDPNSTAASGGWDRRAGFRTEGEAARGRRAEDAAACAVLGAQPVWLPFGSVDYERHGDDDAVLAAVLDVTDGADRVLVPGAPLTHPDHAWLAGLLGRHLAAERIGRYAEQPYALRSGDEAFAAREVSFRDRITKWRAIRRYRSQLPLLGLTGSVRSGPLALALTDERVSDHI